MIDDPTRTVTLYTEWAHRSVRFVDPAQSGAEWIQRNLPGINFYVDQKFEFDDTQPGVCRKVVKFRFDWEDQAVHFKLGMT